jgi:Peptidase A4 family
MRHARLGMSITAFASVLAFGTAPVHAAKAVTVAVPGHTHRLHLDANQQSTNWSGWVNTSGGLGYTSASGNWTVPTVTPTADDRYSSDWVGIGGDPSPDLIQAGTEQDSVGNAAKYYAWYEVLPAPELRITTMTVHAGDSMRCTLSVASGGVWTITLSDLTTPQSFTTTLPYSSTMLTAEWIHEAVTVNGTIANLPKTTNAHFDTALTNGKTIANAGGPQSIQMFDSTGTTAIATPSALDSDGDGFAVADGASAPPAPGS